MYNTNKLKEGYRKSVFFVLFLMFSTTLKAAGEEDPWFQYLPELLISVAALIVVFSAILAIYKMIDVSIRMREFEINEENGLDSYLSEKLANEGSWWKRFYKKMTGSVPLSQEKDILLDHDYDGIKELDNNLPPWWLWGFYFTIVISVFYMAFYHFSPYAKSSAENYEIEMASAQEEVDEYLSKQANSVDENNVVTLMDEESLAAGREIFVASCVACHLDHGGGSSVSVGPNLTDEYWIHGGGITDLFSTIKYGVPEKGMISWKDQIRPADIQRVASYILSLQGTNPPDAKEPQGDLYIADEVQTSTDSTATEAEASIN